MKTCSCTRATAFVVLLSIVAISQAGCDASAILASITKVVSTIAQVFSGVSSALNTVPKATTPTTPTASPSTVTAPKTPVATPTAAVTAPVPAPAPPVAVTPTPPATTVTPPATNNPPSNDAGASLPPSNSSTNSGTRDKGGANNGTPSNAPNANTPDVVQKLRNDYSSYITGPDALALKMPGLVAIGDDTQCGPIQGYANAADAARTFCGLDNGKPNGKFLLADFFNDASPNCIYACQLRLVGAMMKGDTGSIAMYKDQWQSLKSDFVAAFHQAEELKIDLDHQLEVDRDNLRNGMMPEQVNSINAEIVQIIALQAAFQTINSLVYQL